MSAIAKVHEENVAEQTPASFYIDNLSDAGAIALLIPEVTQGESAAIIGADAVEFMSVLRDHESDQVSIGVCGNAENIYYSQLNSIIIELGTYIVTSVAAPLFVTVLGNYISSKISHHNSEDIEIRIELIKGKGNKKKRYRLSGEAKAVLKAVKEIEKK